MIRKPFVEEKEHVQSGDGTVTFRHILKKEELYGHGRMFAEIVIPTGASIGKHRHIDGTEPYYIRQRTHRHRWRCLCARSGRGALD